MDCDSEGGRWVELAQEKLRWKGTSTIRSGEGEKWEGQTVMNE